jgi:phage baseplate assembly protein W
MTAITRQVRDFIDLDFSFVKNPISKNVSIKKNLTSIKQSIVNLLTLKVGDSPFHPEIHSPIYEYLFENFTAVSKSVLKSEIRKYLNVYEPRINIDSVNIAYPDQNSIACSVSCTVVNVIGPIVVNVLINKLR